VTSDEEFVDALPKHELHVHLEGSMPPETLLALRERHRVESLPADLDAIRRWYEFRDFDHFIRTYLLLIETLRDAADFELLARSVIERLAAQNVRYAEVTVTPVIHMMRGIPAAEVVAGVEAGRLAAEAATGPVVRWIVDLPGHLGPEAAERTLDAILDAGGGAPPAAVVGFGLGGPEVDRRPFGPAFARAREAGLRSLPHAGEVSGPESVRAALDALGAERIGHGIAVARDEALLAEVAERGVVLEVCPTSNVRTRVVASYEEHPLRRLLDAGVAVTVNSDDPPMFGTTLREEYLLALTRLGVSRPELLACARTAATAGSAPEPVVAGTLAELDALATVAP
jgi:aminodeoxyfutalosine deaminase